MRNKLDFHGPLIETMLGGGWLRLTFSLTVQQKRKMRNRPTASMGLYRCTNIYINPGVQYLLINKSKLFLEKLS